MMSKRRILNTSSIKKHDNMISVVLDQGGNPVVGPLTVGTGFASLYCPSARPVSLLGNPTTPTVGESNRERQSTYSRGYKERVTVATQTGASWAWRRIVFTFKGNDFYSTTGSQRPWQDLSNLGMARFVMSLSGTQYISVRDLLFDGQEGIDWLSQLTAKVDTTRVKLLSDTTIRINPGNEDGHYKTYRFWTPTNKTLMYDDDEGGPLGENTYQSTGGRIGMGDLYVYDYVSLVVPSATGTPSLSFSPEGTYYWHER